MLSAADREVRQMLYPAQTTSRILQAAPAALFEARSPGRSRQ
jgi:hypothetical protein